MNSKDEIKSLLPKRNRNLDNDTKEKSPVRLLREYGDAIEESYPNYFNTKILTTSVINSESNKRTPEDEKLSYSFYLIANIGQGYYYKLLEVVPKKLEKPYPIDLMFFERNQSKPELIKSQAIFHRKMKSYFRSSFFDNVVNNLMGQVDLYNESRKEL